MAVVKNFLVNIKAENSADLFIRMFKVFCDLGCEMSIQRHFINSHLDQETGQDDYLKESGFTKILRKWMVVTKEVCKNTWQQTTAGASSEMGSGKFYKRKSYKRKFLP